MPPIASLLQRRQVATTISPTTYALLVALLVISSVSLVCCGALLMIRHYRKHQINTDPFTAPPYPHDDDCDEKAHNYTKRVSSVVLPEIRIQLVDSGRVVAVKLGHGDFDTSDDEDDGLPAYRPLKDPRVIQAEMKERR